MFKSLCIILFLSASILSSQNLQTNFAPIKYDRGKPVSTIHDGLKVEAASGALSISIPLGPPYKVSNLSYQPMLRGHWLPQGHTVTEPRIGYIPPDGRGGGPIYYVAGYSDVFSMKSSGGFSPSGYLVMQLGDPQAASDLAVYNDYITRGWLHIESMLEINRLTSAPNIELSTSFSLPNGENGTLVGFGGVTDADPIMWTELDPTKFKIPNKSEIKTLISDFGFGSEWKISPAPGSVARNADGSFPQILENEKSFINLGSNDSFVVGLYKNLPSQIISEDNAQIPAAIDGQLENQEEMSTSVSQNIEAVAFQGISTTNQPLWSPSELIHIPFAYNSKSYGSTSSSYMRIPGTLLIIKNDIAYVYEFIGPEFTPPSGAINWKRLLLNGAYKCVSMRNKHGDAIIFGNSSEGIYLERNGVKTIPNNRPKYEIEYINFPKIGGPKIPKTFHIKRVKNINTGEELSIDYKNMTEMGGCGVPSQGTISKLDLVYLPSTITTPGKKTNLSWRSYQYLRMRAYGYEFFPSNPLALKSETPICPGAVVHPVYSVGVVGISNQDTATGSTRTTYHSRVVPKPNWASPGMWNETTFIDTISNPDGTKTILKFVEPPQLQGGIYTKEQILKTKAFIKHLVQKEEYYNSAGKLYKSIDNDVNSLTLKSFMDPNETFISHAEPIFTKKTTINLDPETGQQIDQVVEELRDFDPDNPGWKKQIVTQQAPTTEIKITQKTFKWMPKLGEVKIETEQKPGLPVFNYIYDSKGRIDSISFEGIVYKYYYNKDDISEFNYQDLHLPSKIVISSTQAAQLRNSGNIGQWYEYDKLGRLSKIRQFGSSSVVSQEYDDNGYVISQTDPNGIQQLFDWDSSGRLLMSRRTGEETEEYIYEQDHPDHLGVTLRKGSMHSVLRFNGFGELIRESRNSTDGWSHRVVGYGPSGRKRWETVWRTGMGDDQSWANELGPDDLFQGGTPGYWDRVCTRWVFDRILREEKCMGWKDVWVPPTGQLIYKNSTHYTYDAQGRLMKVRDPNGVITTTAYTPGAFGTRKTVTRGEGADASVTHFEADGFGRLRAAINESEQGPLLTSYTYDLADRIKQVDQWSSASILNGAWVGSGQRQVRSWAYNPMGWLQQLTQPESGTTTYSDFDVAGRPWRTNYNGRIVDSTFDPLGRVLSIKAQDGTVDQSFTYDEAGRGASKGKLTSARSGQVHRDLFYSGLNGRLSHIERKIDGFTFKQEINYDTYGNVSTRRYPSHVSPENLGVSQVLSYDNPRGMPESSGYGTVVSLFDYDPVHWGLVQANTPLGTSTAQTRYSYAEDQKRLIALSHGAIVRPGAQEIPLPSWAYVYDDQGRLLRDGEDRYTYDRLGRIKTALVRDPVGTQPIFQSFDYDAFGNRIQASTGSVTNWVPGNPEPASLSVSPSVRTGLTNQVANIQFSAARPELLKNQLPSTTIQGYPTGAAYDPQGNLIQVFPRVGASGEAISMSYDALGRVSSMAYGPSATRKAEQYLYDDEGLRIRVWDGSTYRYNIYNEARQLIAQFEKTPTDPLTWKKDILYVGTKEIAEVSSDGKTRVTLCDHLGSPRYVWDGVTAPVQQKFLPFGEALHDPTTAGKFAKGFTNHEQTDPSGMIYMQARFYLPMWGRFASPDPKLDQHFQDTQSWNIYSYVRNSPVMKVDPRGEDARLSIDREKKTVRIDLPVVLNSKGVSAADFKAAVEKQWNNGGKGFSAELSKGGVLGALGLKDDYKVSFNATVVSSGDKKGVEALQKEFGKTVNTVTLANNVKEMRASSFDGTGMSQVLGNKGVFRNYAEGWDKGGSFQNVWGHEVGHFLGLKDLVFGGIMKDSSGGSVKPEHVQSVVDVFNSTSASQIDIQSSSHR